MNLFVGGFSWYLLQGSTITKRLNHLKQRGEIVLHISSISVPKSYSVQKDVSIAPKKVELINTCTQKLEADLQKKFSEFCHAKLSIFLYAKRGFALVTKSTLKEGRNFSSFLPGCDQHFSEINFCYQGGRVSLKKIVVLVSNSSTQGLSSLRI